MARGGQWLLALAFLARMHHEMLERDGGGEALGKGRIDQLEVFPYISGFHLGWWISTTFWEGEKSSCYVQLIIQACNCKNEGLVLVGWKFPAPRTNLTKGLNYFLDLRKLRHNLRPKKAEHVLHLKNPHIFLFRSRSCTREARDFFFRWVVGSLARWLQEPDQISFNAALDACCKGQAMVNSAAGGGLEKICWVFPGGAKKGVRGNGNMQLRSWLSILNSYLLMALNLAPSNSQISSEPPPPGNAGHAGAILVAEWPRIVSWILSKNIVCSPTDGWTRLRGK